MKQKKRKDKEINLDQQVSFLKKIDFFNDFDDHELRQFLLVSKWLKVPKGKQIIKEGTVERVFYILVKGKVSVFKTVDNKGNTMELTTLSTGDCFGEMSLVTAIKRTAGVKTLKESFILMVEPHIISTSNVFLQLKFYKRFCEILVSRLIMANDRMVIQEEVEEETAPAQPDSKDKETEPPHEERDELIETITAPQQKEIDLTTLPPMPSKDDRIPKVNIQRRIRPIQNVAVNPAVAAQLSPLLGSKETSDSRRIMELITLDPALSLEVLQVANSSYYRRSNPVGSVAHAMVTLGVDHIKKVAEEAIEESKPMRMFSGFSSLSQSFWLHSVVVARIADMLKDLIRVNISADVYLGGLLHDAGMLSLDILKPQFYPQLLRPDSELSKDLIAAEKEYIGVDHGRAGGWLSEKMGIPEEYQDIMRFHHAPEKAQNNIVLVALVHLADLFAISKGGYMGGAIHHVPSPMESPAWSLLQEHHQPFLEVNIYDFIRSFDKELSKIWSVITEGILI